VSGAEVSREIGFRHSLIPFLPVLRSRSPWHRVEVGGGKEEVMARVLTPERQILKEEALSLRHDYGLSVPKIMRQLNLARPTLYRYLSHNSNGGVSHNSAKITHLEGDCLELLKV